MQNKKSIKRDNSKKGKIKAQSGITLIALIITIIVLLILAGVALATLTGDSGILSNAEKAKEQTKYANAKEQVKLAVQGAITEGLGKISYRNLVTELDKMVGVGKYTITPEDAEGPWTVEVTGSGYTTTISETGKTSDEEEANISVKLTLSHENTTLKEEELANVSDVTEENVPIPEGFYFVGGTKDTGVVISDVSGDNLNNDAGGNQFVWVPVNQKQKLTLEVTSKEEIEGITLIGPDGTETAVTPNEKTSHRQEITMTKNGVYAVEVKTASETKTAQKRITSLYAQDIEMDVLYGTNSSKIQAEQMNSRYETAEEFKTANGEGKTIEELAAESNLSVGMYMLQNRIFIDELEEEFKGAGRMMVGGLYTDNNQNTVSVEKYGGFYIARFEAGDGIAEEPRDHSNSADTNELVSKKGAYVYIDIACEDSAEASDAMRLASGMKTNSYVTSQLITGAGWDRTLNWIIETGKSEHEVIVDSRSWGNYRNSTGNAATNAGSANMNYTTGRSEYWKVNNIYDLAGNTWEWTQEQYDSSYIEGTGTVSITRGGDFYHNGDNYPASSRNINDPAYQNNNISFRTQLYIK